MRTIFHKCKCFTVPFIAFLAVIGLLLVVFSKPDIHILINKHNSELADIFFKYYTNVGDGLVPLFLSLILLLFSIRKAFLLGFSCALAGIFSQLFKQIIVPNIDRPKIFFQEIYTLHFVSGIDVHSSHSFPSGHTATAFGFFMVLAYFTQKKPLQLVYFMLALLVGYSRIYLSQHFLFDVYFGALFGVLSAFIIIFMMQKLNQEWLDKSILKIINGKR